MRLICLLIFQLPTTLIHNIFSYNNRIDLNRLTYTVSFGYPNSCFFKPFSFFIPATGISNKYFTNQLFYVIHKWMLSKSGCTNE